MKINTLRAVCFRSYSPSGYGKSIYFNEIMFDAKLPTVRAEIALLETTAEPPNKEPPVTPIFTPFTADDKLAVLVCRLSISELAELLKPVNALIATVLEAVLP